MLVLGKRMISSLWLLKHDIFYLPRIESKNFNFMGDALGKMSAMSYCLIIKKSSYERFY